MPTPIYLDYAAATPVDVKVLQAMQPYFSDVFYNPSALYVGARDAKKALESARADVAITIGAKPSEIIFTAGGTESTNLAINGVMDSYPAAELLISSIEHEAVLEPANKYTYAVIECNKKGLINPEEVVNKITDATILISCMFANNEVGTLQPIADIVNQVNYIRRERQKLGNKLPLYVHTDACQAPLYLSVKVKNLGVDMMTLNGGKIYGPKQSGILYKSSKVQLKPFIRGGGQEFGLRSGTENVAFAIGFAKALQLAQEGHITRAREMTDLRDYFIQELESRFDAQLNGHRSHRLANNVHAYFKDADNERMLFALDDMDVYATAGSACSASSDTSSHVLLAMGHDDAYARSCLRFTLGRSNTEDQINEVLDKIAIALKA